MVVTERQHDQEPLPDKLGKDCYSRAFFLTGKITRERPLQSREIIQLLKDCDPVSQPEVGNLVWIICHDKQHLAVIDGLQPITVADRKGIGGEVRESLPLTEVLFEFGGLDTPAIYLRYK